jgi:hypothetical protein
VGDLDFAVGESFSVHDLPGNPICAMTSDIHSHSPHRSGDRKRSRRTEKLENLNGYPIYPRHLCALRSRIAQLAGNDEERDETLGMLGILPGNTVVQISDYDTRPRRTV